MRKHLNNKPYRIVYKFINFGFTEHFVIYLSIVEQCFNSDFKHLLAVEKQIIMQINLNSQKLKDK